MNQEVEPLARKMENLPSELARRLEQLPKEKRALLERELRSRGLRQNGPPPLQTRNDDSQPLSYSQERLWFLWQLEPENPAYNRPAFLRLSGALNQASIAWALNELRRRHEVLRAHYPLRDGRPEQKLGLWGPIPLKFHSLRQLANSSREAELQRLARSAAREPFDLINGPVLRFQLVEFAPNDHFLLLTFHHIAFDAWSAVVLVDELSRLYEARERGSSPAADAANQKSIPLPAIQYADFAAWQRKYFETGLCQSDLEYWKQELQGPLPVLELPIAKNQAASPRFNGESVPVDFPAGLVCDLRAFCEAERVTSFTVLLAAYQILLWRYAGQDDVIVGCPVAGRTQLETEILIGCFVNTLALRSELRAGLTFRETLGEVRQKVSLALEHQALPFEKVIETINPPRLGNRTPIFQTVLNYRNLPPQQVPCTRLNFVPWSCEDGIAPFELALDLTQDANAIHGRWVFDGDRFLRDDIHQLGGHFQTLLENLLAQPDRSISKISLFSDAEREHLLARETPSDADKSRAGPIHELFAAQARLRPSAVAVVFENQTLTYGELDNRANQVAHFLRTQGVGPEVLVGLCLERSLDMLIGILAILKAGGAYVPLDPAYPAARLRWMLDDSTARVLLTQEKLRSNLPESSARVVCLDSDWPKISGGPSSSPLVETLPHHPAYVIYTSGSTGQPKGVVVTHGNVTRLFHQTEHWFGFNDNDVWTMFHSDAFDFSVWEIWGALLHGGRLVVVPGLVSRSAPEFLELLVRQKVTVLNQTPSAFRQLVQHEAGLANPREVNLRLIIFGGESLELQSLSPWIQRHGDELPKLVNMYGITETTVHVTFRRIRAADLDHQGGSLIGVPIPDLQLFLLDRYLEPVPPGVPGEICIAGPGLARGYLNQADLTSVRFIRHPFSTNSGDRLYRSGDQAKYNAQGELEYLGRIDQQIKIRGHRVELGEIESALARHPAVGEAVVLLREEKSGDQRLRAYFVPRMGATLAADELRAHLRSLLPEYMLPAAFISLSALPLTHQGKIDRRALAALDQPEALPEQTFVSFRTPVEEKLTEIWSAVLGVKKIGVHDSFFDVGGHSLLAIHLLSEIQQHFGRAFQLAALFSATTISQFAKFLEPTQKNASPPSGSLRGARTGTPVFYLPGGAGFEFFPSAVAERVGKMRPFYDGLQYPGLDGAGPPLDRIEDIAAALVLQIRQISPSGPYLLCGFSIGGLLAYEVARQMHAQRLPVEAVFIWDTYCPGRPIPKRSFFGLLRSLARHLAAMDSASRVSWVAGLAQAKLAVRSAKIRRRLLVSPPSPTTEQECRSGQVEEAALRATRRYQPGPYSGKVVLFQVNYWDFAYLFKARDSQGGWGAVASDLEIIPIPGLHEFVLKEPAVSVLADKMCDYLQKQ